MLAVAIIGAVGWQFARQLRDPVLWERPLAPHPAWLAACAVLYIAGFGFFAAFWCILVRGVGGHAPLPPLVRAFYVSQLGKYVPGKAWTLLLRAALARHAGVRTSVAVATAIYETLTTMASGALLAVVLSAVLAFGEAHLWRAAGLLAVAGIPIVPGVFNRILGVLTRVIQRRAKRTGEDGPAPLIPVRTATLAGGLAVTACGWALFGLSLWTLLRAILPEPPAWSFADWGRLTASLAMAYVVGFLIPSPGGLGTREFVLQQLLTPELTPLVGAEATGVATAAALLLRLVWTSAEVLAAAVLYVVPVARAAATSDPGSPP